MNLQTLLNEKGMTLGHLSEASGVPQAMLLDICSCRSEIGACNAQAVQRLAQALDCTMEDLMRIDTADYRKGSGLPKSDQRFEKGLPTYLQESIDAMVNSWKIIDSGGQDIHWDLNWCDLNADINYAEIEQEISFEQAWYLRKKYLRMEKPEAR